MSTQSRQGSQPETSEMIVRWAPQFNNEGELMARVKDRDSSRVPTEDDLEASENALKCQKCYNLNVLEPCTHCKGVHFSMQMSSYNQIGLFCRSCTRAYTGTTCSCGTAMALGHNSIQKKVLVRPVPPSTIIRWVGAGLVALLLLYFLFRLS